jgi:hypothetical protein
MEIGWNEGDAKAYNEFKESCHQEAYQDAWKQLRRNPAVVGKMSFDEIVCYHESIITKIGVHEAADFRKMVVSQTRALETLLDLTSAFYNARRH